MLMRSQKKSSRILSSGIPSVPAFRAGGMVVPVEAVVEKPIKNKFQK
jgi:hypothetical protein